MESSCRVVSSLPAILLVLHLGLIPTKAQQNEVQVGVAGQEVILNCRGIPSNTGVTWKYYKAVIRSFTTSSLKGKATMADRSHIDPSSKHLKLMDLRMSDVGIYTCAYGSHTVTISLHVFKLTVSSDGHFLPSDVPELTLMQNSTHPLPDLAITLFDSNNKTVIPQHSPDKTPQKYTLKLKQLEATDSGTWVCHIHSDSPPINHNIFFDVKVLGFQNPDLERRYATVGSTVTLSWHLNFHQIQWNKDFTGALHWAKHEGATAHKLLDFNITAQGQQHEMTKSRRFQLEIPQNTPKSTIEVKLPKVHFNYSGQYLCQLMYKGKHTESKIELVVMKVSANPVGPLLRGTIMTLTCQVSSHLPASAHLRWERVNGTQTDTKQSKPNAAKVEVNVSAAGLWNCHLIEDSHRKISLNYPVEEAPAWTSYVVIGASVGGSVLVLSLVCLCIISGVRRQQRRQRARRMAQARQHLLENKTCQCHHQLKK
ncbi:T-cell surface glycoprotein CD4 [Melanerpes formicivorus]|uniref:T-cell surface glycoprotein CD4 n=1 Tax=Melanerpes formicivorus TaxID=211600 RepID=UPI00358EC0B5